MTESGDDAVVDDPWASADPALTASSAVPPLTRRLAVLAAVREQRELDPAIAPELVEAVTAGAVDAAELPEVAALAAEAWRVLELAPVYVGVLRRYRPGNAGGSPTGCPTSP